MTAYHFLALLRALATPNGSAGKLLPERRESHLLQAELYARLAEAGEQERKAEEQNNVGSGKLLPVRRESHLLQAGLYARLAEAGEQERKIRRTKQCTV